MNCDQVFTVLCCTEDYGRDGSGKGSGGRHFSISGMIYTLQTHVEFTFNYY